MRKILEISARCKVQLTSICVINEIRLFQFGDRAELFLLQVRAHKVVLSSSSSFFRQFLRDHSQPNPWLFLRGVEAKLLDWLMDFIYLGEVMVTQESFPSFLALARDLGVRGLTGATPAIGKKQEKQQQEESTAAPSNNFPSSGYTTQSGFSSQSGYASQSGYTDVAKDGTVEYLAG